MMMRLIALAAGAGTASAPREIPYRQPLKRAVDVTAALGLLAVSAPIMLAAAALIRLTSAGPAVIRQTRVGAGGTEFSLFKLRTMINDAERYTGPVMAVHGDRRITAVGRVLRALRIDELPQLFNVLLGEMSLVGPRPERPYFVEIYRRRIPGYDLRHRVRPGITGLAQIYGHYSSMAEHKLRYDLAYIQNCSLALDAEILCKTILIVLQPSRSEGLRRTPLSSQSLRH